MVGVDLYNYTLNNLSRVFNFTKEIYVSSQTEKCYWWGGSPTYECFREHSHGIHFGNLIAGMALIAIGSYLLYRAYTSYKEYKKRLELLERK